MKHFWGLAIHFLGRQKLFRERRFAPRLVAYCAVPGTLTLVLTKNDILGRRDHLRWKKRYQTGTVRRSVPGNLSPIGNVSSTVRRSILFLRYFPIGDRFPH